MDLHWFLLGSIAIGIAQLLDAQLLWRNGGRLSLTVLCFSLAEWIWAALALWVLLRAPDAAVPAWLPGLFIAYVVGFALHAARTPPPPEPGLRCLSAREIQAGALFGAVYLVLSLGVAGVAWVAA